ncbi:trypsin-like serine protease [bacterium NHP-B]|nr:trypsin-like serine protease [bacterium NHP-B]
MIFFIAIVFLWVREVVAMEDGTKVKDTAVKNFVVIPPDPGSLRRDADSGLFFYGTDDIQPLRTSENVLQPDCMLSNDAGFVYKIKKISFDSTASGDIQPRSPSEPIAQTEGQERKDLHSEEALLFPTPRSKTMSDSFLLAKIKQGRGWACTHHLRTPVENATESPFSSIGRLLMTYENGAIYLGTGRAITQNHILTAAHNVFYWSKGLCADEICFQPGLRGDRAIDNVEVASIVIPRAYVEAQNEEERRKNDIALLKLDRPLTIVIPPFSLLSLEEGDHVPVMVAGYPGDVQNGRYMYKAQSPLVSMSDSRLFYNLQTAPGQSGASVLLLDPKFADYPTVGVHTHGAAHKKAIDEGIYFNMHLRANKEARENQRLLEESLNSGVAMNHKIIQDFIQPAICEESVNLSPTAIEVCGASLTIKRRQSF